MEVNPIEEDLWRQVREEKIDIGVLHEMIEELRYTTIILTDRILELSYPNIGAPDGSSVCKYDWLILDVLSELCRLGNCLTSSIQVPLIVLMYLTKLGPVFESHPRAAVL